MATRGPTGHRLFLTGILLAAVGCGGPSASTDKRGREQPAPTVGPDCDALLDAARRAASCDEALGALATTVEGSPDETRCRIEARRLIGPDRSPEVASLYATPWPDGRAPLDEEERERLSRLALPASLRIEPDLAPMPGRPVTSARLGGRGLSGAEDGTVTAYRLPGPYTLELHHADETREHCVVLEACADVALTAHGAQLASHPAVKPGPCAEPTGPAIKPSTAEVEAAE